jgi:hypothetical protein
MASLDDVLERLQRIEDQLNVILTAMDAPQIALTVNKLSSTTSDPDGRVVPGSMVLDGSKASGFFKGLKNPTVLPLQDLPPWTHMALAEGRWWLIAMGAPSPE